MSPMEAPNFFHEKHSKLKVTLRNKWFIYAFSLCMYRYFRLTWNCQTVSKEILITLSTFHEYISSCIDSYIISCNMSMVAHISDGENSIKNLSYGPL